MSMPPLALATGIGVFHRCRRLTASFMLMSIAVERSKSECMQNARIPVAFQVIPR
jgi:hypothetical protein